MSHHRVIDRSSRLITPERASSLTDQVYRRLRQDIIEGRWARGGVLLETRLAAEFEISKTPIREALQVLVQEGWITVRPSRGYLVRPVRLRDIGEMYGLLRMIEPSLVADAARAGHRTDVGRHIVAALGARLDAQRSNRRDPQLSLDAAREFHLAFAELGRNQRAESVAERVLAEVRRLHYVLPPTRSRHVADIEIAAHEGILAAIERGDPAAAAELASEHLEEMVDAMMRSYVVVRTGKYIAGDLVSRAAIPEDFLKGGGESVDRPGREGTLMRFDSAGVGIHYDDRGTGEPVVLVHGFTGSGSYWADSGVLENLLADHRVITFDVRGHGRSDKPHDPASYGPEMSLDIVRLLDHLGIEKAHVVGYSMGGFITMVLLTLRPERFLTATVAGAPGPVGWTDEDVESLRNAAVDVERGSVREMLRNLWPLGEPQPSDDELDVLGAPHFVDNDPRALADVLRSMASYLITLEQVAAIGVPTIGIAGTLDPQLEKYAPLRRAMPQLRMVEVEGADHGSCASSPEFIAAVREHLAGSAASADSSESLAR